MRFGQIHPIRALGLCCEASSLINQAAMSFNQGLEKMIFFFIKITITSDLPEANLTWF